TELRPERLFDDLEGRADGPACDAAGARGSTELVLARTQRASTHAPGEPEAVDARAPSETERSGNRHQPRTRTCLSIRPRRLDTPPASGATTRLPLNDREPHRRDLVEAVGHRRAIVTLRGQRTQT